MLRGVEDRDLSIELFGDEYDTPVLLAPIGVQSIIHDDGELETAEAARDLDLTLGLCGLDDVSDVDGSLVRERYG